MAEFIQMVFNCFVELNSHEIVWDVSTHTSFVSFVPFISSKSTICFSDNFFCKGLKLIHSFVKFDRPKD